jgi:Serine hydrolase (FSH1)
VLVGGFKNDAPQHAPLYRRQFTLSSVHIIGRADRVIPPRESQDLADQFGNP